MNVSSTSVRKWQASLSNQTQIPVIAPGYWAANKHVWEGQWPHIDTQTQETWLTRSAVVLVWISGLDPGSFLGLWQEYNNKIMITKPYLYNSSKNKVYKVFWQSKKEQDTQGDSRLNLRAEQDKVKEKRCSWNKMQDTRY